MKMFQDKKATIKNKITVELQELTGLKWSFKDKKKKGIFYSNQYATLSADEFDAFFGEAVSASVQKIEEFAKEGFSLMIDRSFAKKWRAKN